MPAGFNNIVLLGKIGSRLDIWFIIYLLVVEWGQPSINQPPVGKGHLWIRTPFLFYWFQPIWKILVSWYYYSHIYIYGKIKNVPNHRPVSCSIRSSPSPFLFAKLSRCEFFLWQHLKTTFSELSRIVLSCVFPVAELSREQFFAEACYFDVPSNFHLGGFGRC